MLPPETLKPLQKKIKEVDHPRELAVDVMYALQSHYGYLTDEAVLVPEYVRGNLNAYPWGFGRRIFYRFELTF